MKRLGSLALLLICLLTHGSLLQAQSVVVKPATPQAALGTTLQFSALVTGLSPTDVTWSAGGVKGGSALAGTITPAGLYQAPATMPAQNPVQISARSVANSAKSASVYIYLITPGPTITAVSPNPVAVGNLTVTIQGTGFLPGAMVYDNYGGYGAIQLSTSAMTASSITAHGYQGNANAAAFSVRNPGSDYSNTLTVPISGSTAATYTLNVVNGSGGGSYAAGKVVTITANTPPAGQSFLGWTGATVQNSSASTTTLTMPAANAAITANYSAAGAYTLNVVNGVGSGAYAAGTVVTITANAAPAGQAFANWTGAAVQNANAAVTTLTMPALSTSVTANYAAVAVNIPYPVSSHPRLWVTTTDLPRLQNWAEPTNAIYVQGIVPLLAQAVSVYNTYFFPNGIANPNYPDPGDAQGYGYINNVGTSNTEEWSAILAFNSLIDPNPANRITYAQDARNMLMVAMNQAVLGHLAGAPFRDPTFAIYNRANGSGEEWPLTVDWLYNAQDAQKNPILTAADKATIRTVFLMWANDCVNASTTGNDHPSPIGVTNSSAQLLQGNKPYRMASNNYYLGHARLITMMSLCIDPSDDPVVNTSLPASQMGNTLRSYILNANGAWLYQEFAMMGDPSTVTNAYGLPGSGAGFGLSSGGLPPEGMLYGHSYAYILGQLLALQTAGFNDPTLSGPQIGLIGAPVWDRFVTGYISSLTPTAQVPASQPWLGPVYQYGSYGDLLRLWVTPDAMQPFALLALLDGENGSTAHANAARWFATNAVEGGSAGLMSRISSASAYGTTQELLYFLLMDPTAGLATDPRPSFPTTFVDPAAGRIVAHSDWSPGGTMFDYRASWESINHQVGDGGQFELYRNGEWLTKEMSNYDNNDLGLTTVYHNTLALQNYCVNGTPNLSWFDIGEWRNGSQWILGANAGDPTTVTSSGPGYVYAASDLTPLYNRPSFWSPNNGTTNITQATRSIVWLNNDYIVVYDRATSLNSGLFKRFNLSLVTHPVITGSTATETLASGQQLFVQTLLPASPSLSAVYAAGTLNPIAQLEPTQYVFTAEDATRPADVRFLHVLQGADPGAAMVSAIYAQSTGGTAFDGAVFGSTAVYFPVSTSGVFAQTALTVPTGVHTLLLTGLTASTAYGVSIQPGGAGSVITVTSGGSGAIADGAGVVRLTF